MAAIVFCFSILLIGYTFFGYPLLLFVVSRFVDRKVKRGKTTPDVTVVIPVHNEENQIRAKLENCLRFDYPRDRLRLVVVSDNSTDGTVEIARSFGADRVTVFQLPFRGGKVAAQNYAMRLLRSEVVLFSDVAITNDPDCVRLIVENFVDPDIGVVSCRDSVVVNGEPSGGESSYIRYDMMVRRFTSRMGSIIGVTGGFYAVRGRIAEGGWNPAFPPDFYVALRSIKMNMRVIEDPRVKAYYREAAREGDELRRKVRTINRGMNALFSSTNKSLLNPLKYGMVSVSLISHKVFRWLMPFFLISMLLSNIFMLDEGAPALLFLFLQLVLYGFALLAFAWRGMREGAVGKLALYFIMANIAIMRSWMELFRGKRYLMWEPTKR